MCDYFFGLFSVEDQIVVIASSFEVLSILPVSILVAVCDEAEDCSIILILAFELQIVVG